MTAPRCPRCHVKSVRRLKGVRQYGAAQDWFRCEECEHFFTTGPPRDPFDQRDDRRDGTDAVRDEKT